LVAATYGRSMYKVYLDDFVSVEKKPAAGIVLNIFPNPAQNEITLQNPFSEAENFEYQVFDMGGTRVLSGNYSGKDLHLNIGQLTPGNYSVLVTGENLKATAKFLKTE
jgi:hypothetical protein